MMHRYTLPSGLASVEASSLGLLKMGELEEAMKEALLELALKEYELELVKSKP